MANCQVFKANNSRLSNMSQTNMLNIKQLPLRCLYVSITLAVMHVVAAPASAQSVIIINGAGVHQHPAAGYSIYGTPVNTHRVFHPVRRITPHRSYYPYPYVRQNIVNPTQIYPTVNYPINTLRVINPVTRQAPYGGYYPYPNVRQNIVNPTQIYPTVNHPMIRDSTIVNPVPVNNSWRRTPFRGRSRVILNYPH
jgi:hypothetical protein